MTRNLNRRDLLKVGAGGSAVLLIGAQLNVIARAAEIHRDAGAYVALDAATAATVAAYAARILPTTDTPGANEAGAIWFIDAALAGDLVEDLALVKASASALDAIAGGAFALLGVEAQDRMITAQEGSGFFELMRFLTFAGSFTMSRYGGNRGEIGWDILGFERRHHWQAPFGYYDQAVHGGEVSGS
ncbi:MAG: gluconate 2-dehydrogenase gamma chain [Halieaceae bacterium]